jgi:farnesyl diphosphate synthase
VHDDLPAMDDDDMRRGRPTLHRHTDEATAILAGDAMHTLAFAALDGPEPAGPADPARIRLLARELVGATLGMISGQVLDTTPGARPDATAEGVARIHDLKTGALIRAACRMGAIAALPDLGSDDARAALASITDYAVAIGRMYQVVDDILDVTQSADHAGKATGKDAAMGKLTSPAVLGLDGSRALVEDLLIEARTAADNLGSGATVLKDLAGFFARRTR